MNDSSWNKIGALALIGVFFYVVLAGSGGNANCPTFAPQPAGSVDLKTEGSATRIDPTPPLPPRHKVGSNDRNGDLEVTAEEGAKKTTTSRVAERPGVAATEMTPAGISGDDSAPVWLRGNFARFSARGSDRNCKAYPSIGTLGVACDPKAWKTKQTVGGGDNDGTTPGDTPQSLLPSVVFEMQYPGLSVTKVVGTSGGAGEDMYKSNIMGSRWDASSGPQEVTPRRSVKYSYQVERAGSTSAAAEDEEGGGPPRRTKFDTVTIRLPNPADGTKLDSASGGKFVFLFDLEVKDPASSLRNASTCFISIGDWGNPQPCQKEVSQVMAKVAEDHWARFVVSTGDNFYPTGVKGKNDPQFDKKFEKVYNKAFEGSSSLPNLQWVLCAGNHDQWGIQGELEYGRAHPQWWMPARVFAKRVPVGVQSTANLVILDTYNRMRGSWEKQGKWFEQQMEESSAQEREWKLVINHEPVYCGSNHGLGPDNVKIKKFWKPLLDKHQAEGYFNGDDHTLQISRETTTDYFVSGGGGGSTGYTAKRLPENVWFSKEPVFGVMLHCISDNWGTHSRSSEAGEVDDIMTTKLFNKEGEHIHTHYTTRNKNRGGGKGEE